MNKKTSDSSIALNKKARHDYFIEDLFEGGLVLQGWEVKSLREGKCQLVDSYIIIKRNEVWWIGGLITPLLSASTHTVHEPTRTRKILLHRKEINKLIGKVEQKGYTLVPLRLYWDDGLAKLQLGVAKGKKQHDKRDTEKDRDWKRDRQRILKAH